MALEIKMGKTNQINHESLKQGITKENLAKMSQINFKQEASMHMYYAFDNHIYSFSFMTTICFSSFGRHISFSGLMPIPSELYTHVYIHKILIPMKC